MRIQSFVMGLLLVGCASGPSVKTKPVKPKVVFKAATTAAEIQAAFDTAVAAFQAQPPELETARDGFLTAIKGAPAFAAAHFNLGLVYEQLGQTRDAERELKTALDQVPEEHQRPIIMALGKLYLEEGQMQNAEQMFQKALMTDAEDRVVKQNLAALYRRVKDYDTALKFVREILSREPKNIAALNTLGLIYLDQGQLDMAQWVFGKAMKFSEKSPSAHVLNNVGLVWMARKDIPTGVSFFQKAAAADATHLASRHNLGRLYLSYLNYAGAAEQYQNVLNIKSDDVTAAGGLAEAYFGQSMFQEAADQYKKVVDLDANNAVAYKRLGKLYEEYLRDQAAALKYYREYLRVANPPKTDPLIQQIAFLEESIRRGGAKEPEPEEKKERPTGARPEGFDAVSIDEALTADPNAPTEGEDPCVAPSDPAAAAEWAPPPQCQNPAPATPTDTAPDTTEQGSPGQPQAAAVPSGDAAAQGGTP